MPIIRIPQSRHCSGLSRLQAKRLSSSTATPTQSRIARLILDQKSAPEAIETFRWASSLPNFRHSQSTYRALIHKLCSFRRFDAAKDILDEIPLSLGSPPDDATFVTLVRALGQAGLVRRALRVPDLATKIRGGSPPSLKVFNSVLNVLVGENIDLARDFFRNQMAAAGLHGDRYTFAILMKGLCSANRIAQAFKLLQLIKSSSSGPNAVIYNTLLHALCRNGSVGRARSLMNEIPEPSSVTFNILISAYCAEGSLVNALVMLEKCFSSGLLPDAISLTKVLDSLCLAGRVPEAVELLERFERQGGTPDVVCHNALVRGFCASGKPRGGARVMKEMERKGCLPSTETYDLLISGFCRSGMLDDAVDLFREMEGAGVRRSFDTFEALISGLCSGGRVGEGIRILHLMEETKEGSRGRISPYNSVLYGLYTEGRAEEGLEFLAEMERLFPRAVGRSLEIFGFCERREIDEAKRVYDQMVGEGGSPSAFVYSRLIVGFCRDGRLREALELTNEMISSGCSPVASTFNSIICGFCGEGRLDSAVRLMEDMDARGCTLDAESYGPVLRCLCEEGDFQKALQVFTQMTEKGIVPDYFSWNSLTLRLSRETLWLEKNDDARVEKNLEYIMGTC